MFLYTREGAILKCLNCWHRHVEQTYYGSNNCAVESLNSINLLKLSFTLSWSTLCNPYYENKRESQPWLGSKLPSLLLLPHHFTDKMPWTHGCYTLHCNQPSQKSAEELYFSNTVCKPHPFFKNLLRFEKFSANPAIPALVTLNTFPTSVLLLNIWNLCFPSITFFCSQHNINKCQQTN